MKLYLHFWEVDAVLGQALRLGVASLGGRGRALPIEAYLGVQFRDRGLLLRFLGHHKFGVTF